MWGLALGGLGLLGSIYGSKRAGKETRKANQVRSRMESRQMQRERQQMLRQSQIAQATGAQMAASSGVSDSSGFEGSQAGIRATYLGNLAFSSQVESGAGQMQRYVNRAGAWQTRGQTAGAIGQFAMQAQATLAKGGAG